MQFHVTTIDFYWDFELKTSKHIHEVISVIIERYASIWKNIAWIMHAMKSDTYTHRAGNMASCSAKEHAKRERRFNLHLRSVARLRQTTRVSSSWKCISDDRPSLGCALDTYIEKEWETETGHLERFINSRYYSRWKKQIVQSNALFASQLTWICITYHMQISRAYWKSYT